jgi:hypothetical protein
MPQVAGTSARSLTADNTCVGGDGKVLSPDTIDYMTKDMQVAAATALSLFEQLLTEGAAVEKECKARCELTPEEAMDQKIKDMQNDVLSATDVVIVEPDGADCVRKVYVPFTNELFETSKRAGKGCVTKASIGTLMPRVRLGSRTLVVGSPEFLTALDREATDVLDTLTYGELQKLLAKAKTIGDSDAVKKEAAVLGGPLAQVLHVMFGWELSHIYDSMYMFALFNAGIKVSKPGCKSVPRKNLLAAALGAL